MEYAFICVKQVFTMFVIMFLGAFCYRKKMISKEASKCISDISLLLVTPACVFISYQTEFSKKILIELLIALLMSVVSHFLMLIISKFLISKKNKEYAIERFSLVYTNSGFMGLPLVQGIFGNEGVLFVTAYITAFQFIAWTVGLKSIRGDLTKKEVLGLFKSPAIIGVLVGLVFFVTNIRLPQFLLSPISAIASMNTPLGMLVVGTTIGQTNIKNILVNKRGWLITALRMLVIPAIIIPIMSFVPVRDIVYMTVMLALCCPTAAIATLFAMKYDKNAVYASELFSLATLSSAITLPIMILYISLFR